MIFFVIKGNICVVDEPESIWISFFCECAERKARKNRQEKKERIETNC